MKQKLDFDKSTETTEEANRRSREEERKEIVARIKTEPEPEEKRVAVCETATKMVGGYMCDNVTPEDQDDKDYCVARIEKQKAQQKRDVRPVDRKQARHGSLQSEARGSVSGPSDSASGGFFFPDENSPGMSLRSAVMPSPRSGMPGYSTPSGHTTPGGYATLAAALFPVDLIPRYLTPPATPTSSLTPPG